MKKNFKKYWKTAKILEKTGKFVNLKKWELCYAFDTECSKITAYGSIFAFCSIMIQPDTKNSHHGSLIFQMKDNYKSYYYELIITRNIDSEIVHVQKQNFGKSTKLHVLLKPVTK